MDRRIDTKEKLLEEAWMVNILLNLNKEKLKQNLVIE